MPALRNVATWMPWKPYSLGVRGRANGGLFSVLPNQTMQHFTFDSGMNIGWLSSATFGDDPIEFGPGGGGFDWLLVKYRVQKLQRIT